MVDSVSARGYVIAQEYLPDASEGDTRLFLMNGLPLRHKGKYAAFKRVRFAHAVIQALQRKVDDATYYDRDFSNGDMATL